MPGGRIAILTLALCLALVADSAQSQRRPQQLRVKQPETAVTQEKSHEDQRGTKQSPFIVEVAPTPKTAAEQAEETKERERISDSERKKEKSDSDIVTYTGRLAFFTMALFIATVALVLVTIGLLVAAFYQSRDTKRAIAAAEKSAGAAEKSAKVAEDALTVLEKPFVFIDRKIKLIKSIGETKDFKTQNADFLCHIGVEYFIINHGRTPAIIKNLIATMLIVDAIPEHRTIMGAAEIPPAIAMATGVPDGPLMCLSNEAATVVICDEILRGDKFLFFYGQISYRDVFSYEYLTGFGWRYFVKANIWNPEGGDEYNFHENVSPEPMKKAPFRI